MAGPVLYAFDTKRASPSTLVKPLSHLLSNFVQSLFYIHKHIATSLLRVKSVTPSAALAGPSRCWPGAKLTPGFGFGVLCSPRLPGAHARTERVCNQTSATSSWREGKQRVRRAAKAPGWLAAGLASGHLARPELAFASGGFAPCSLTGSAAGSQHPPCCLPRQSDQGDSPRWHGTTGTTLSGIASRPHILTGKNKPGRHGQDPGGPHLHGLKFLFLFSFL